MTRSRALSLVAATPRRGRKDELGRCGARVCLTVAGELVAGGGKDVDASDPGLGLRVADGDAAVGEVDVLPGQGGRLADPQAGVDERRDQRAAPGRARLRLRVALGRGIDHCHDLLGGVEVDGPLPLRLQLAVAGVHANRVADDEVALLRHGENLPKSRDRLVDRLGGEHPLANLELAIAVDLSDRDLRQPVGSSGCGQTRSRSARLRHADRGFSLRRRWRGAARRRAWTLVIRAGAGRSRGLPWSRRRGTRTASSAAYGSRSRSCRGTAAS
jgi:hypothetical protein